MRRFYKIDSTLKNILAFAAVSVFLFSIIACNNDLDPTGEFRDIPVIYGLLDPGQDTQFIRIHKSFLGNVPVDQMAQIPDSIYYTNMVARLEEVDNNTVVKVIPLNQTTNRTMDQGFFTTDGFRLYYTTEPLNSTSEYRIVVSRPGEKDATAITEIVQPFSIIRPAFNPTLDNFINFSGASYEFRWQNPSNANNFTMVLDLSYREQKNSDRNQIENKTARFTINYLAVGNTDNTVIRSLLMNEYFTNLTEQIPTDPSVNRYPDTLKVSIVAGHDLIERYVSINSPPTGINQELPLFTNVENGVGLFSSRRVVPEPGVRRFFLFDDLSRQRFAAVNNASRQMCGKRFVYITTTGDSLICVNGNTIQLQ